MGGALGFLGMLGLGQMGANTISDRRDARNNTLLQGGIQAAMGERPSAFNADLFPGEAPIEGLYNEGSGLLADPNDMGNQLEFASAIFNQPGGAEFGGNIFRDALGYGQKNQQFQQQEQRLGGQFDQSLQQNNEQFRARLATDSFWKDQNLANDQYEFQQGQQADLNKPPPNMEWALDQQSGQPLMDQTGQRIPVPGFNSPTWLKYKGTQDGLESNIETMDELITLFDQSGTEQFPTEAKGRLAAMASVMQLRAKDFLDTGALSQDELALINKVIRDPTELLMAGTSRAEIKGGYNEALKLLQRALRQNNQSTSGWRGMGSQLDRQTPSQARAAQDQAIADTRAQQMGLTDERPAAGQPAVPAFQQSGDLSGMMQRYGGN